MLTFTSDFGGHLQADVTSLTVCYAVEKKDGSILRGTAHDRDVTIPSGPYAGTYLARTAAFATDIRTTSDSSIPNLEMEGAFRVDAEPTDLKVEEIEGGLYDQATAYLLLVNWANPGMGNKVLCFGTLGVFSRDSDGRYRSEVRGLKQALSQQIIRTYSERCDVREFGDARCKKDVTAITRTGTVTAVTDRKHFDVALDAGPAPLTPTYFDGSRMLFTSGANDGFIREAHQVVVASALTSAEISLWDEAPADIQVGDTISLPPACDRQFGTCRDVHDNLVNFRGHGFYAVGRLALMRGAGT